MEVLRMYEEVIPKEEYKFVEFPSGRRYNRKMTADEKGESHSEP
jgi:hypothetical protein